MKNKGRCFINSACISDILNLPHLSQIKIPAATKFTKCTEGKGGRQSVNQHSKSKTINFFMCNLVTTWDLRLTEHMDACLTEKDMRF
jgi:hypothetical protein